MTCVCHGEPAYWVKDVRYAASGYWECRVKRREHNRQRTLNPARQAQRHLRDLRAQRIQALNKLSQLEREARLLGA